jgi:hypothetical protein
LDQRAQALARRLIADLLRDADVLAVRQEYKIACRQRDLHGQARALGADRVFEYLHDNLLPVLQQFVNRL